MFSSCARPVLSAALLALLASPGWAEEPESQSLIEAFQESEFHLGLRYRFESVDDDAVTRSADASTLRTSFSLKTADFHEVSLFLEMENVAVLGDRDSFRNAGAGGASNGVFDRPVVADVAQTELNQAYLLWSPDTVSVKAGRQEVNLADQRFVGAVGWRQNHQSFDAVMIEGRVGEEVALGYTYLDRVHRIFGDSRDLDSHLVTLRTGFGSAAVRAYGLLLDYEALEFAAGSTRTVGVEVSGGWKVSPGAEFLCEVEFANQADAGDNPLDVDVDYLHGMAGLDFGEISLRVGWESLEGGEEGRFSTPLATLHKFNGWADRFLSTPEAGLEDLYLEVRARRGPWSGSATYHQFDAENASADYGSELDLSLGWKSPWGQQFALKVADYSADDFSVDTTKWMAWSAYTF